MKMVYHVPIPDLFRNYFRVEILTCFCRPSLCERFHSKAIFLNFVGGSSRYCVIFGPILPSSCQNLLVLQASVASGGTPNEASSKRCLLSATVVWLLDLLSSIFCHQTRSEARTFESVENQEKTDFTCGCPHTFCATLVHLYGQKGRKTPYFRLHP